MDAVQLAVAAANSAKGGPRFELHPEAVEL